MDNPFKIIFNAFERLAKQLNPPDPYSWQTLIWLTLFSSAMSFLATGFVKEYIATFGWIFLIFGIAWLTTEYPIYVGKFSISPWITGAFICTFLFGKNQNFPPIAVLSWPTISAIVAAIPDFITNDFKFKVPKPDHRQKLVIIFSSQFLISCWLQFYFLLQVWLEQYPSLVADDFQRSAFVMKMDSQPTLPRGMVILNLMDAPLSNQLDNKPWSDVERSLLEQNRPILLNSLRNQAIATLPQLEEDRLWQLQSDVSLQPSGYILTLIAVWQGPRSRQETYQAEKNCQIRQIFPRITSVTDNNSQVPISEVTCQPATIQGLTLK